MTSQPQKRSDEEMLRAAVPFGTGKLPLSWRGGGCTPRRQSDRTKTRMNLRRERNARRSSGRAPAPYRRKGAGRESNLLSHGLRSSSRACKKTDEVVRPEERRSIRLSYVTLPEGRRDGGTRTRNFRLLKHVLRSGSRSCVEAPPRGRTSCRETETMKEPTKVRRETCSIRLSYSRESSDCLERPSASPAGGTRTRNRGINSAWTPVRQSVLLRVVDFHFEVDLSIRRRGGREGWLRPSVSAKTRRPSTGPIVCERLRRRSLAGRPASLP